MRVERPPKARATVTRSPNGLEISIPPKRDGTRLGGYSLLLAVWGFTTSSLTGLFELLRDGLDLHFMFFAVLSIGMWCIMGAVGLKGMLWEVFGRERISVGRGVLAVRREILGVGHQRVYDLSHVRNLRVSPSQPGSSRLGNAVQSWGISSGVIAFDYGATTVRIGSGVEEGEADLLVSDIRRDNLLPRSSAA